MRPATSRELLTVEWLARSAREHRFVTPPWRAVPVPAKPNELVVRLHPHYPGAGALGKVPAPTIFFSAALAIIPIAALIVQSTEQIASRTGDAVGGLAQRDLR